MALRPYQAKAIKDLEEALQKHDKILFQLATGGGKTFIFCELINRNPDKKILILVNRDELVGQTVKSLSKFGIACEQITAKTKSVVGHTNVFVAMEKTLWNRLKKIPDFIPPIDIAIADECHRAEFDKFVPLFPKVIGFTATPVRIERQTFFSCYKCGDQSDFLDECCGEEMQEWTQEHTLSQHYDTIITSADIKDLIDEGFLVPERPYAVKIADLSQLKTRAGEFTEESINEAYLSKDALFNVVKNYKAYCQGRKTMIFSASTKQNLAVYNQFVADGFTNIQMYDSVNSKADRKEVVEWFKNTPEAILCNVNVFTTGFDVTDVEAIIVNRPTQSLSLWLQIVGRGARIDPKAGKTDLIVIDGGGNIDRLERWSFPRDWVDIFNNGLKPAKPKKEVLEEVAECKECGALIPKTATVCDSCGVIIIKKPKNKAKKESEAIAKPLYLPPIPKADKIIELAQRQNQNQGFAFKILINMIVDLFRGHQIPIEKYLNSKRTGEFYRKIDLIYRPIYFAIITSDLPSSGNKTLINTKNRIINAINKHYGIS